MPPVSVNPLREKIKILNVAKLILGPFTGASEFTLRTATVPLGVGTSGGGVFAWANPEPGPIAVNRVTLDVTTVASAAATVSVGQAANGTTSSANLIDTLDVRTAAGLFDNLKNPGTLGKASQRVAAGAFVTGSQASGAVAGLVGNAYIEYLKL